MAVKQKGKDETTTTATGTEATSAAPEKKSRKPRASRNWQWTEDRQLALAAILKSPKGAGMIRTAGSVAQALSQHPLFEGIELTGAMVLSYVNGLVARYGADNRPAPAHLNLDSARVKPNLSLFE